MGPGPDREPPADAGGFVVPGPATTNAEPPVVGLAHGSRHPESARWTEDLMAAVARELGVEARSAYLDLAEPGLGEVARRLAAAGHDRAVVVPLLFTEAFHATVDVPQAVADAAAESGVALQVAGIVGTGDDVLDLLQATLSAVGAPDDAAVLVVAVGSSRPAANAAVADLADRLAARRGTPARAAFGTCDPRPGAVADGLGPRVAIAPLFLADGLLLRPLRRLAAERGWPMAEPIGDRAATLVADRYRAALTRPAG